MAALMQPMHEDYSLANEQVCIRYTRRFLLPTFTYTALSLHQPFFSLLLAGCLLGCVLANLTQEPHPLMAPQSNKSSLLSSKPFLQVLVSLLDHHIRADTGALVINALLEFFTYAVCDPYSDTTSNEHFDTVLDIVAGTCGRRYGRAVLCSLPLFFFLMGAGGVFPTRYLIEVNKRGARARFSLPLPQHV
jgi:hypothetical protein